jgi:hypothetical protein
MISATFKINSVQLTNMLRNHFNSRVAPVIVKEAKEVIKDTIRYSVNKHMKNEVIKYAPSPTIEKLALTSGIDDKSRFVGYPSTSSTFMKEPEFLYLVDAIARDAKFAIQEIDSKNMYTLLFSLSEESRKKINNEIGFAWMKKIGNNMLERRSTLDMNAYHPTWDKLLDMWEYGASNPTFTVRARDINSKLHAGPDKRIASSSIIKTITPHRMFYLGMKSAKDKIIEDIQIKLKARFSKK